MISNKYNILIIVVLSVSLLFSIFKGCNVVQNDITPSYKNSIDSVNVIIDSLKIKQLELDSNLNYQIYKMDSISNQISYTDKKIIDVKKHYENQINIVRNFSDDELTKFFTDRYK